MNFNDAKFGQDLAKELDFEQRRRKRRRKRSHKRRK